MRYLPPGVERRRVLLAFASLWLCACGESRPVEGTGGPVDPGAGGETCIADDWCAGAARVVVSPSQQHVDGIEHTLGGGRGAQFEHVLRNPTNQGLFRAVNDVRALRSHAPTPRPTLAEAHFRGAGVVPWARL